MAKVPKPQITAWSYSRLSTYLECPAKAKYKFIDKLQEPPHGTVPVQGKDHKTRFCKGW